VLTISSVSSKSIGIGVVVPRVLTVPGLAYRDVLMSVIDTILSPTDSSAVRGGEILLTFALPGKRFAGIREWFCDIALWQER